MHPPSSYHYPEEYQQRVRQLCGNQSKITQDAKAGLDISARLHHRIDEERSGLELKTLEAIIKGDEVPIADRQRAVGRLQHVNRLEELMEEFSAHKQAWLVRQPILAEPHGQPQAAVAHLGT